MKFIDSEGYKLSRQDAIDKVYGYFPPEVVEGIFRYYSEYKDISELKIDWDFVYVKVNQDFDYALDWEDAKVMTEHDYRETWDNDTDAEEIKRQLVNLGWIDLKNTFNIDTEFWLYPQSHNE